MSQLIARFLNAKKNADGTVSLEFGFGNQFGGASGLTQMILSSAEVTALDAVLTGVTGTKTTATHSRENADLGYHN